MSEERFDRMEGLMTQLIQMVAENNKAIIRMEQRLDSMERRMDSIEQRMDNIEQRMDSIEQRMDSMEQRMDGIEQRFSAEEKRNEVRHKEVMKEIRNMSFEIDYLHKQSAKHDMEIHVIRESQL